MIREAGTTAIFGFHGSYQKTRTMILIKPLSPSSRHVPGRSPIDLPSYVHLFIDHYLIHEHTLWVVYVTVAADLSSLIPGILPFQGAYQITETAQARIGSK